MDKNIIEWNRRKLTLIKNLFNQEQPGFGDDEVYEGINAVLSFFRVKTRIDETLPLSKQLKEIDDAAGIKAWYIDLEKDWYKTAVIPLLITTKEGKHLAVIPKLSGRCECIENGKRTAITAEKAESVENSALCFFKCQDVGNLTQMGLLAFLIKSFTLTEALGVILACTLTVLAGLLLPLVNRFIFLRVVPQEDFSLVIPTASLLFSAITITAIMKRARSVILGNTIQRANIFMQSSIYSRLLMLKPDFFKTIKSGELSRVIVEISDLTNFFSANSISAVISVVLSLVYLLQINTYAPELTGFAAVISSIFITLMVIEGMISGRWYKTYADSLSKMSGFCYETFSGIENIKLNGAQRQSMERWRERYADTAQCWRKPWLLEYMPVLYKFVTLTSTFMIFALGSGIPVANYIAFSASYGAYLGAFLNTGVIVQSLSRYFSAFNLAKPLIDAEAEVYNKASCDIDEMEGNIRISGLSFRYGDDLPYALENISLDIRKGESVGIIGTSGSGKSTLIRILLGFETIEEGIVEIDGYEIGEFDLRSYRSHIGTVLQNDGLLNGDIYSNITIAKPDANMDEVRLAVERAGLKEDIEAMPMGLYTLVSAENGTLSGGQRQRIMIARAIVSNPSILIFDEATSALDNITQDKITRSLNELKCTKIIVAHRLSTIRDCDKIVVMDKGRIVQQGTYAELSRDDDIFAELIKNQM